MTDDPGPIEDPINAPDKQDPATDLPEPNTGNDDADDTEEPADLGEDLDDEGPERQDQQTG